MTDGAHRPPTSAPDADFVRPQGGLADPYRPAAAPAQWPGAFATATASQQPVTPKRPKVEFSGRRLAVMVLVILLLAGAGAGGVAYGYAQGRDGTTEYYQPQVADMRTQLAAVAAILAKQSADAAAVPNLAAVAAKHPGMEPLNQTATSLEVTFKDTDPDGKIVAVYAFMTELGFTGATIDRMGKTRTLDGTQTAQGHNCNVSWTYDDGLQLVFEAKVA